MSEQALEIDSWITKVKKAKNAKEVFALLAEFRPLKWNNEERAAMAKAYVRVLERVGVADVQVDALEEEDKEDGPVWYEKM